MAQDFFSEAAVLYLPSRRLTAMALPMKKTAAMKAMKAKTMKAMKAKKVSVIARGRYAKALVFNGRKEKTVGGMTKSNLVKNRFGKIVSKKASERAKKNFASSGLKAWCDAVKAARKALNLTGLLAIGGKSATGKALYAKAKSLLK